jgi:hypothetical protein
MSFLIYLLLTTAQWVQLKFKTCLVVFLGVTWREVVLGFQYRPGLGKETGVWIPTWFKVRGRVWVR